MPIIVTVARPARPVVLDEAAWAAAEPTTFVNCTFVR